MKSILIIIYKQGSSVGDLVANTAIARVNTFILYILVLVIIAQC